MGDGNNDWVFKPAEGRSGGILSIWNPSIFMKLGAHVENGFICVKGVWGHNRTDCGDNKCILILPSCIKEGNVVEN